jgi:hypothetical protein
MKVNHLNKVCTAKSFFYAHLWRSCPIVRIKEDLQGISWQSEQSNLALLSISLLIFSNIFGLAGS